MNKQIKRQIKDPTPFELLGEWTEKVGTLCGETYCLKYKLRDSDHVFVVKLASKGAISDFKLGLFCSHKEKCL